MVITQTPLRISLAGGGTDFADFYTQDEGFVVSSAIDRYVYVIIKERFDRKIYINYSRKEIVDAVDEIQHELVRECMKKMGLEDSVEITTLSDVPAEGTGLGSSSSVTVGLLNAMYAYGGEGQSAERLAREACEIEVDILHKPIGKQDQYIASYGNLRSFRFRKNGEVDVETVPLGKEARRRLGARLLLFFTDRTREASGILAEQKSNIECKREILRRIRNLAYGAREVLMAQREDALGGLLDEGWKLKKQLASQISDPELDTLYERARAAGATGGKISGAGGGGFFLLYCPVDRQDAVRQTLSGLREMPFRLEEHGSRVIFNVRSNDLG